MKNPNGVGRVERFSSAALAGLMTLKKAPLSTMNRTSAPLTFAVIWGRRSTIVIGNSRILPRVH
jgi:hypothetical protein